MYINEKVQRDGPETVCRKEMSVPATLAKLPSPDPTLVLRPSGCLWLCFSEYEFVGPNNALRLSKT